MTENNNNDNIIEENESKGNVKGQIKDWRARHPVISCIICLFLLGSLVSLTGCKDKIEQIQITDANAKKSPSIKAAYEAIAFSHPPRRSEHRYYWWWLSYFFDDKIFTCVVDANYPVKGSFGEVYPRLMLVGEKKGERYLYTKAVIITYANILPPDDNALKILDIASGRKDFKKYKAVLGEVNNRFFLDLQVKNVHNSFLFGEISILDRMRVKFPGGLQTTFNTNDLYKNCIMELEDYRKIEYYRELAYYK